MGIAGLIERGDGREPQRVGADGLNAIVLGLRAELRWRFGWRRLVNAVRLAWAWKQNRKATAAPLEAAVAAVIAWHAEPGGRTDSLDSCRRLRRAF